MALIKCPQCGREISENAASCPSCRAPVAAVPTPIPPQLTKRTLYVVQIDGKESGPYEFGVLQRLFVEGKISPETPFKICGSSNWQPLQAIYQQILAFEEPAPASSSRDTLTQPPSALLPSFVSHIGRAFEFKEPKVVIGAVLLCVLALGVGLWWGVVYMSSAVKDANREAEREALKAQQIQAELEKQRRIHNAALETLQKWGKDREAEATKLYNTATNALANWKEQIEVNEQIRAQLSRAASQTPTSSPQIVSPQRSLANSVEVLELTTRITESNSSWSRWAWKLRLRNNTDSPQKVDATLEFLDKDGFVIKDDYEHDLSLKAGETVTFTGFDLIGSDVTSNVAKAQAKLKTRR